MHERRRPPLPAQCQDLRVGIGAAAVVERDRQQLLGVIESGFGSVEHFNERMRTAFSTLLQAKYMAWENWSKAKLIPHPCSAAATLGLASTPPPR